MRKIVELTAAGVENTHVTQCSVVVIARCDDDSVWISRGLFGPWERMDDIPQDKQETDERDRLKATAQPVCNDLLCRCCTGVSR